MVGLKNRAGVQRKENNVVAKEQKRQVERHKTKRLAEQNRGNRRAN